MSSENEQGTIRGASDGGVAGSHHSVGAHEIFVGPTTASDRNLIKMNVIPVACWRVDDVRFEFDSSFVKPEVASEIGHLKELREKHKIESITGEPPVKVFPPISIFGHADPVGSDDYNKTLSGRRATAIYGLLTRDTVLWEELYTHPFGEDKWGLKSIQFMLSDLGLFRGTVNGKNNAETKEAVTNFQRVKGLKPDGDPGPKTREALFLAYMDKICGADFTLDPESDFLARGVDEGGKGDYQGCSEFNPLLLFSQEEFARFQREDQKEARNKANAQNRRVMVLLFRPGSRVNPNKWPCPRAKEDKAGCLKRFWSDGEKRRSTRLPGKQRKFQDTKDTFACRFYDRISSNSPCESILENVEIRLYDLTGAFIPNAPFVATLGRGKRFADKANARGNVILRDVKVPDTCHIEWGFQPEPGEPVELVFSLDVHLNVEEQEEREEATKKLNNLGYPPQFGLSENVKSFQADYGHLENPPLEENGVLDKRTLQLIRKVHQKCADDLHETT